MTFILAMKWTESVADIPYVRPKHRVPSIAIIPFVLVTFAITWGLLGLHIFRPDLAVEWFGEMGGTHPFFILATWGPAFAAFVVTSVYGGFSGFKSFLSRLAIWRCSLWWAAFLLVGVPLTFALGALAKGTLTRPLQFESLGALLGLMGFMLFLGPVEEFGWRGVAQPILQRHMTPIWAGLLIGATWGFWHLPAFYLAGTVQSGWSFPPFFIGNVTLAVIVTPLFNASRGSILLPALFHFQLINPLWPDAQPYDTYLFVLVACVVVWANRDSMFTRAGSVSEVIPNANREP